MIDAHRIVYNQFDSLEFDVTTHCAFDNESGTVETFLSRDAVATETYNGSRRYIHGATYTDSATPRFTLIKTDFSDFNEVENRKILSWLTSADKPSWLEVYKDDSNVVSWRCYGIVGTIEQYKLSNGRVVGYEFEFISDSPHMWSPNFEATKLINGLTSMAIECETDEYGKVLYPTITIQFNSDNIILPINEDPNAITYQMLPNVIYSYNGKYYVNIDGGKHILTKLGSSVDNQVWNKDTLNRYYFYENVVYKGIVYYELATTFKTGEIYYIDIEGNKPTAQPTSNEDIQSGEYYIQKKDANGSVMYGYKIVAMVGAGIQIKNTYTLNGETKTATLELVGNTKNEKVILDGTNKIVSSSLTSNSALGRIIGEDFNWEWLPLAEGTNNITVIGNCDIKFEWIEPRKVGSL